MQAKRSSDCPRCLKRVKLVGYGGVMPRHLDPMTRKVCESGGYSPSDAASHVRREAEGEAKRKAVIERAQAEHVGQVADDAIDLGHSN